MQATSWENSDLSNRMSLESHGAGKFVRARGSLEAQLLVLPTLEITNSLPYIMEVGNGGHGSTLCLTSHASAPGLDPWLFASLLLHLPQG